MKQAISALAVIAVVVTASAAKTPAPAKAMANKKPGQLTILYASCAQGQIRSCNCTIMRYGGYGRELTLVKSIYSSNPDTIMLEGGDIGENKDAQANLKNEVAAKARKLSGCGAMVPGEQDLGLTGDQSIKQFTSLPITCANLYAKGETKPIFPPYRILVTKSKRRIGVIGIIDTKLGGKYLERGFGQMTLDPVPVLKSLVPTVRKKSDFLVLLYHGTPDSAEQFLSIKGLDVILCTHKVDRELLLPNRDTNEASSQVDMRNGVMLIKSGTHRNRSLGRVDIVLSENGKVKSAQHKLIFLDRSLAEDPAIVKLYDAYNQKTTQLVLGQLKKFKKESETLLIKQGLNPQEMRKRLRKSSFAGAEKCKECHEDIYASWKTTRHSHAIDSLKKTKQEYDPECVSCHVTGIGVRNGYTNYQETPELANVQCEACHGPSLAHANSSSTTKPSKVGEETCRSCHTDERTPEFDYDSALAKIAHK